ncbi:3-oxoacyl-reductase [Coniochaeta ligniaria NRRL 30616]|uniref:3-oxoacyl-reductase n=1 Tax=Coniochaeta ligniaria NRRL 30616 TaxID=1408157 RepID=A0A1J7JEN7_9PEZI|nr:3-oxoacyl-reductase [Coniochaeta ligniaria NRRL 30616]
MNYDPNNELKGKLALITGASGGIGAACAKALWGQNVSLALTYWSDGDRLSEIFQDLIRSKRRESSKDTKITIYQANMASEDDIKRLYADIQAHHDRLPDILISNAGYGKRIPNIADISLDEFDHTISVNLRASFILCKLAIPYMTEKQWGRVIFVSSIAAHGGGINGCHYAASKAGLTGLMKNLANKHAKDGITFNDVAPAMIGDTGMIPDEKFVEGTPGDVRNIPVGRLGTPSEVSNVVMMFCQTGYMTGQSVLLSGGLK